MKSILSVPFNGKFQQFKEIQFLTITLSTSYRAANQNKTRLCLKVNKKQDSTLGSVKKFIFIFCNVM